MSRPSLLISLSSQITCDWTFANTSVCALASSAFHSVQFLLTHVLEGLQAIDPSPCYRSDLLNEKRTGVLI